MNTTHLDLESLEERILLSSVQIYAAGSTGQESLALRIDDAVVAEFNNVGGNVDAREFVELEFQTEQTISGDQIRIDFVNDFFDPSTGFDRNVVIDRIVIDGVTHETEGFSVYHTGLFANGGLTGPGLLQTENLNINGSLFFSSDNAAPAPTDERQVTFVARGTTGEEIVSLRVDGVVVERFQLGTVNQQFEFRTSGDFRPEQIEFAFENDLFDAANGIDRNVTLEFLEFENLGTGEQVRFDGSSSEVFSTGTYLSSDGVRPGFGRGDTLHANGVFRFGTDGSGQPDPGDSGSGSIVRFAAVGTTGEEVVQLLANEEVIFETELGRTFTVFGNVTRAEYEVVTDLDLDLTDLRLAFVNDGVSETGDDRDVLVDYILVEDRDTGEVQRTTAADNSTFSTGTFVDGQLQDGLGRGFVLHTNGFFQFANSSRILVSASGSSGEERFQVLVNEQVVAEFGDDEGTQVEFETSLVRQFVVDVEQSVDIEDVRIAFINDGVSADGVDRDLNVFEVRLDGRAYDTDTAFSTGSFQDSDGIVPGTGRGFQLNTNGFFQFGVVNDAGSVQLPDFRSAPRVTVLGLAPENISRNPFGPFATHNEEEGDIIVRLERNFGLDEGFVVFQVLPSSSLNFGGPVPNNISQDPITVQFADGQLATNLVIPLDDNSVPDSGFFDIAVVGGSEGIDDGVGRFLVQLVDADG